MTSVVTSASRLFFLLSQSSHEADNYRYWLVGNCLAGDTCVFSHDPANLVNNMSLEDVNAGNGGPNIHPSFQVQDYDAFPSLQSTMMNQWADGSMFSGQYLPYNYGGSHGSQGIVANAPGTFVEGRGDSFMLANLSSSPRSHGSRPSSRHQSRAATPSIPSVDDTEAFPSLGSANLKGVKKHHGKRGGHGHNHGNKDITPSSLADVVRMSPSPAPSVMRKGLAKSRSYTGSRENSLAANAIQSPQHIPWMETGEKANQAYIKARQDAFKHGGLRNKFLQR